MNIYTELIPLGSTAVQICNGSGAAASGSATSATAITFTVSSGGSYYNVAPPVTLSGGSGSYTSAAATISGGQVTGVTVTGATGYTLDDSITVTFGSQVKPGSQNILFPLACKLRVEPLAGNAHTMYVGNSSVNSNGTGVVSTLVKSAQASQQSPTHFEISTCGKNAVDLSQWYFTGTSGDSAVVSWFVI